MERWTLDSLEGERAPFRPKSNAYSWIVLGLSLALVCAFGAYQYYFLAAPAQSASRAPATAATVPEEAPAGAPPRTVLRLPEQAVAGLPALEESDSAAREALAGLVGRPAFDELFLPAQLVRRIVATVDNLPRPTAPRRMVPLAGVPGAFRTHGAGDETTVEAANAARYAPFVRMLEALDARAAVARYAAAYPLFQRAYEELGFPGAYFNDRLLFAIDDMLATPTPGEPVRLVRGRVLYEFADPDLETRSAGQKALLRMGPENAARVKAKLVELRREIVARAVVAPPPGRIPAKE